MPHGREKTHPYWRGKSRSSSNEKELYDSTILLLWVKPRENKVKAASP